ncbi:MAG: tetratricopeptide repeat protein [Nitrospiria bacterium]
MFFRKSTIIEKTQKLASKGEFDKAIQEWEKMLSSSPNDGNILNAIGDLHLKAGHKEKATEIFVKAGEAFQEAGFELKSIAVLKKALKVDPSQVAIYEKLAAVNADRGLIGNAIGDYLKASKYYLQQDDFQASLSVYRKISDLDPKNSDIRIKIAEMCQKQGHTEEALEEYKKALAILNDNGKTADSEDILSKIQELDSENIKVENNASATFNESSDNESSETDIEAPDMEDLASAVETDTPYFDPNASVSEISGLLEPEPEQMTDESTLYSPEDSLQTNDEGLEIDETDTDVLHDSEKSLQHYLTEAEVYCQYKLFDKALEQLHSATERYPDSIELHLKLKAVYIAQGTTEKVVEECSILATLYKDNQDEDNRQAVLDELMAITSKDAEQSESPLDEVADAQIDSNRLDENTSSVDTQSDFQTDGAKEDVFPADSEPEDTSFIENLVSTGHEDDLTLNALNTEDDLNKYDLDVEEASQPTTDKNITPYLEGASVNSSFTRKEDATEPLDPVLPKDADEETFGNDSLSIDYDEPTLAAIDSESDIAHFDADTGENGFEKSAKQKRSDTEMTTAAELEKGIDEEYIDLQEIISEDLEEQENETTLDKTIRFLKDKAENDKNAQEIETQYDLGIAYKEMDMMPEAIDAFQLASLGEHRFQDAMTMLVSCHRENGSIDDAITILEKVLEDRPCPPDVKIGLKYELALLYEQQGNKKSALKIYNAILNKDPSFRDVPSRCTALSDQALEGAWMASEETSKTENKVKTKKKDRVSYL